MYRFAELYNLVVATRRLTVNTTSPCSRFELRKSKQRGVGLHGLCTNRWVNKKNSNPPFHGLEWLVPSMYVHSSELDHWVVKSVHARNKTFQPIKWRVR